MQELTTFLRTLVPEIRTSIVSPLCPYLVESGDMIAWVGHTLSEAIRGESNQLRFWVNQEHLLRPLLLTSKATKTIGTGLWRIFAGLNAVKNMLRLSFIINTCIISPAVRSKDERGDIIEFSVTGCSFCVMGAVRFATPSKVALTRSLLMLHILLAPTPQTVEDILFIHLYGNHHTIRHTLCASIVVFDI